jgi:hypothetical protein
VTGSTGGTARDHCITGSRSSSGGGRLRTFVFGRGLNLWGSMGSTLGCRLPKLVGEDVLPLADASLPLCGSEAPFDGEEAGLPLNVGRRPLGCRGSAYLAGSSLPRLRTFVGANMLVEPARGANSGAISYSRGSLILPTGVGDFGRPLRATTLEETVDRAGSRTDSYSSGEDCAAAPVLLAGEGDCGPPLMAIMLGD